MIIASEQFDINDVCIVTSFRSHILIVYTLGCEDVN